MADGSPKTPAPSAVAAQARAGAPAAQGDMDRICLPCAGLIRVEACYRDAWNTPLTNACVRVEDSTGVVVDGAVRTEPLIAHGLKDGDAPTAPLATMGTTPPIEVAQGTSEVTLVPQGAGEADAGMGDLGAALAAFRDGALVKLQPYVLEWEARGLLSIPEARFRGVGKGLSAWYQGEADFWGGVSDRAVAAYQNAQNWHDAYVARQSPFEQGMMQYGGPFGAIAVYGTSLVETAAETVSDWISGADDLAAYIATIMAAMRDLASGTVDLMEAALDSLRALPGEAGRLFSQLIDNGQDWIERLVLIASETNAFEYVFHVFMAVAMNMTPNFWAEMAGVVSGFILPEVLIEIILAVIAALTGGGGIALLAGRLATFVAKLRGLAVKAKSLGVLASIVEAFGKAISALAKIGKGLHDEIEAFTRAGANGVARIRHRVNQYKVEIDPNTLGMNGGNIRIVRKREKPRGRLPRSNGRWDGEPGNGTWYPDNTDARSVLGEDGVPFRNGRPDFSRWSAGEIEFEPGVLNGSDADFARVYEQVKEAGGLASNTEAKDYLRKAGLTPHHHSDTVIQLIPTKLHKNIPHIGSASDMRSNF
ncbi:HNH endonuclease [Tritonibacter mobilis]|uniref:Uncharacterized protein n=3 Tax=Tritonibacter mobilis TaxID=379347 RepID=A0A1B1AAH0_9RHOB|nr:HNH endonuclease [Tritonibacter mobilis]ANP43575.1 hypothetical protein K529_022740 [Tritonibacter mobilis F1926]